jgi:DNA-binding MarR family transcriptional regulator
MAPSKSDKYRVAEAAWRSIFDFIVTTAGERNRAIGELGLTPNDARALTSLNASNGRTMGELAAEWRCDASTATWIVDRLESRGLARRRPHPHDRRARLVLLTPKGVRVRERQIQGVYLPPHQLLELSLEELIALKEAAARLPRR